MKHQLKNEFLTVTINDVGAELVGLYDEKKQHEVLWQGDAAYWKRQAPILFPNVGKHYGNEYLYKGKKYPSSQHGFARDMEFTCISKDAASITHQLTSTETTKENYPFDFLLEVTHLLENDTLKIQWKVKNTGNDTMYFTIGGHPGFRVPVLPDTKLTDYHLLFEKEELSYCLIDTSTGTAMPDTTYPLPLEKKSCPITEHMFDKDALIFDNQIEWAAITYPDGSPYVSMSCKGFPSFGIWAAPGAPYVCLEPWDGRCDNQGFAGEISEKPGICSLAAGDVYEKEYSIRVQ